MFDRLIESSTLNAGSKPRGGYFLASTAALTILFLTGIVASLYAQDFGLGTDNFDVAELLTPIAAEAPEPPRPPDQTRPTTQTTAELPQRMHNILRIDESPKAPTSISNVPNSFRSRPISDFLISSHDAGLGGPPAVGTPAHGDGTGSNVTAEETELPPPTATAPPPIKPAVPARPQAPQSLGVITGKAIHLPKPAYSPAAVMMNAQGEVSVQVTVDETGKVVSSKAISGHPILRGPAERAALSARFNPTTLSRVPVKVTGMIVYKFSRN